MEVNKTITAQLTKEDIEDAIGKWMLGQNWDVTSTIRFHIETDIGENHQLAGASFAISQALP